MSNRVAEVRELLRAALPGGAITAERAHAYPQDGDYPTPCAWVGITSLRGDRGGITLTVPVAVVIDGARAEQWRALDAETARLWDALSSVRITDYVRPTVTGAAPQAFGPEGSTARGVVFTVTVDLAVRTLCGDTLT
jgi:hypothetical protein